MPGLAFGFPIFSSHCECCIAEFLYFKICLFLAIVSGGVVGVTPGLLSI